jgi:hypothetical protein
MAARQAQQCIMIKQLRVQAVPPVPSKLILQYDGARPPPPGMLCQCERRTLCAAWHVDKALPYLAEGPHGMTHPIVSCL